MSISEHVRYVSKENATWNFESPTGFTIYPTDQVVMDYVDSNRTKFGHVYMTFESKADHAEFYVQVIFPDQDAFDRRKKLRELANAIPDSQKNLSLDQREALAKRNFNDIADKIIGRSAIQRCSKDFREVNESLIGNSAF